MKSQTPVIGSLYMAWLDPIWGLFMSMHYENRADFFLLSTPDIIIPCLYFSIAVGLEVIEEGTPLDSDSDIGHYAGSDFSDTRKCLVQVQQLNRRVQDLERDLQRNTIGFWSKLAFFAFTIINPVLLHWLFWKRRWNLQDMVALLAIIGVVRNFKEQWCCQYGML